MNYVLSILSFCLFLGQAFAIDLGILYDAPQNISAIRASKDDMDKQYFDVYEAFQIVQREEIARFKAENCLHVKYSNKNDLAEVLRSGKEEGNYVENVAQTLFRFDEPIRDVLRIYITHNDDMTRVDVITKSNTHKLQFFTKKPPKLEEIIATVSPVAPPRLILVVPEGDQAPAFKNPKEG